MAKVRADGPDISRWQWMPLASKDPDFAQMPFFPFFAHRSSRGFDHKDVGFDRAWPAMRTQGYQFRGAYHWMEPRRKVGDSMPIPPVMQAALQVNTVLAHGPLQPGEFLYLDIERSTPDATHNYGGAEWPTIEDCQAYIDQVEEAVGKRIGVYVGQYAVDPNNRPYKDWVKEKGYLWVLPSWIAADGTDAKFDAAKPTGWHIRQYTAAASVQGMPTPVDMNYVLDWSKLSQVAGYGARG